MATTAQLRNYTPRGGGPSRPQSTTIVGRASRSPWTYRLLVLAIFGLIWQAWATQANLLLIPTFTETVQGVGTLLLNPDTFGAFLVSNQALVIGFAISVILGIVLGLGAARFSKIEGFVDPYLSILLVTPMAALIPILLMSLGIELSSRVFLVIVFTIPVIIVNTRTGVRQVDPNLIEMATSFGAKEREIWQKILLPGSLPAIMTGIRLGLGRGVTGMVIIELLMVAVGIGGLILKFQGQFASDLLYALVILVVLEALLLVSAVRFLERKIAPWASGTVLRE
jgi:ABC-type nitrate/sulfonate/bicarbonate transport system permease component